MGGHDPRSRAARRLRLAARRGGDAHQRGAGEACRCARGRSGVAAGRGLTCGRSSSSSRGSARARSGSARPGHGRTARLPRSSPSGMRAAGLADVAVEQVEVDGWRFEDARAGDRRRLHGRRSRARRRARHPKDRRSRPAGRRRRRRASRARPPRRARRDRAASTGARGPPGRAMRGSSWACVGPWGLSSHRRRAGRTSRPRARSAPLTATGTPVLRR